MRRESLAAWLSWTVNLSIDQLIYRMYTTLTYIHEFFDTVSMYEVRIERHKRYYTILHCSVPHGRKDREEKQLTDSCRRVKGKFGNVNIPSNGQTIRREKENSLGCLISEGELARAVPSKKACAKA